ncbi:MAG TPA: hypothetical protein VF345_06935 [Chthoniobacterales bacterium]
MKLVNCARYFILKALADEGLTNAKLYSLRGGGLLVSHDVHCNAAFAEFVAKTHARDKKRASGRAAHHPP